MSPTSASHRRTHNLLLISKLLSIRDSTSPLTLLLDSLEQPATPLIKEYIRRAKLSKVHVIFVSFETLTRPDGVDTFILARRKSLADIAKEVVSTASSPLLPYPSAATASNNRSLMAPVFGLAEEADGVIIGRRIEHGKSTDDDDLNGVVIEMEHRRKSGRGVVEWYFLPPAVRIHRQQVKEMVMLLDDHPLYHRGEEQGGAERGGWEPESTFELGLTERQRLEREGVVLPYFDAQRAEGPGEGGRILYDMGEEDDFDEEEDEI
ncbi:killer toxin sensitivity protein [Histoplasma capsulatum H143]|uniref:Elongator complex protein 5 n=1 Tax=Ajellomyces capsulatus (strain H143) TaxID=544712 RepID=C6H6C7_AJECH|nr:killer toxin sensitivity protein [Histoplasma capsulatum H143]